jgi:hypothetical protein
VKAISTQQEITVEQGDECEMKESPRHKRNAQAQKHAGASSEKADHCSFLITQLQILALFREAPPKGFSLFSCL